MEDIQVTQELKEGVQNRVILLKPDGSRDIITSSDPHKSYYHMLYFRKYLDEHYQKDGRMQSLKLSSTQPGIIIYLLLKKYGNIVFTETTKDYEERRYGILYFPDKVTKEQKEQLSILEQEHFLNFKELLVQAEFYVDEFSMVNNKIYEAVNPPDFDYYNYIKVEEEKHR